MITNIQFQKTIKQVNMDIPYVPDREPDKGYENLANAIVAQAAYDYRIKCNIIHNKYAAAYGIASAYAFSKKPAVYDAIQIEDFFYSDWYKQLTTVPGDYILNQLRKSIKDIRVIRILNEVRELKEGTTNAI